MLYETAPEISKIKAAEKLKEQMNFKRNLCVCLDCRAAFREV